MVNLVTLSSVVNTQTEILKNFFELLFNLFIVINISNYWIMKIAYVFQI